MEVVDILLKFCEQENLDFCNVMNSRKLRIFRIEVRKIIVNRKKQRLILQMSSLDSFKTRKYVFI
jgi:hypothetical protein